MIRNEMFRTNAPIDYDVIYRTVVRLLNEDDLKYGKSIYEYSEGEIRERSYFISSYDENYPEVYRYDGKIIGATNVCYEYKYSGDGGQLIDCILKSKINRVIPLEDSLY